MSLEDLVITGSKETFKVNLGLRGQPEETPTVSIRIKATVDLNTWNIFKVNSIF